MSTVTLAGFAQSSYVWTSRAALNLKGVDYTFTAMNAGDHKAPAYVARHPYGKVPLLTVDGQDIFESAAIVRWAEATGDGPALFPSDALLGARVEQWISVANCYMYDRIVPGYLFKYIFAGESGPDRAAIEAAVPKVAEAIAHLESRMSDDSPWVVGGNLSAADLFIGPLLFVLSNLPEGKAILADSPRCGRLIGALAETAGFMAAAPPRG